MEKISLLYHLFINVFFMAWPFSALCNYLMKKYFISKTVQNDGSGWLSGGVFSAQSSLFGFLSATLVAVLVAQRSQVITSSNKEASSLTSILALSSMYDNCIAQLTKSAIKKYTNHVIHKEWGLMGNPDTNQQEGRLIILDLRKTLLEQHNFFPKATPSKDVIKDKMSFNAPSTKAQQDAISTLSNNIIQENIAERILDRINDLLDRRIERIQSTRTHIPNYVWSFLYISAILVLIGPGFYVINKKSTHLFLMLSLSIVVCTTLMSLHYLKPRYDNKKHRIPGTIKATAFEEVLQYIQEETKPQKSL